MSTWLHRIYYLLYLLHPPRDLKKILDRSIRHDQPSA